LVPVVLGAGASLPAAYGDALTAMLRLPQSVGIVGGPPGASLFLVGHQAQQVCTSRFPGVKCGCTTLCTGKGAGSACVLTCTLAMVVGWRCGHRTREGFRGRFSRACTHTRALQQHAAFAALPYTRTAPSAALPPPHSNDSSTSLNSPAADWCASCDTGVLSGPA
jgi:hypothetical protein